MSIGISQPTGKGPPLSGGFYSIRQPAENNGRNSVFTTDVEVVAIRDDLDAARPAAAALELFGGIKIAQFPVAAQEKRRAGDARREFEDIGAIRLQVEKALGAAGLPPARQPHQFSP